MFNETIVAPTAVFYEEFNFDTADDKYYGMVYNSVGSSHFYYHNEDDYSDPVIAYDFGDNTWTGEAYRTITFDGEQEMSKEFYEWFTSNAVEQTEETYKLSGTWIFNDKPICSSLSESYEQDCSFTSNGYACTGFSVTAGSYNTNQNTTCYATLYYYGMPDDDAFDILEWGGWTSEEYRTIIFDGEQTVSKEFYDWFTANATMVSGDTSD